MATALDIIKQAFREGNFIAVGEDPTVEEIAESIPRLHNLIESLFGFEIGEAYSDWHVPSVFVSEALLRSPLTPATSVTASSADLYKFPPPNVRLLVKTTEARTIYLPANPCDGARMQFLNIASSGVVVTIDGNGHLVESAATVAATTSALHGRKWFYRADLGDWTRLTAVVDEDDPMPLPEEFDDLLVCGLAIRLSARFEVTVKPETFGRFTDMMRRLKKRYKQTSGMPASFNELRSTLPSATTMDL